MLNEMIENIHGMAVAHGWWDTDRGYTDPICMCMTELSEAIEEYRNGRPMEWYGCMAMTCEMLNEHKAICTINRNIRCSSRREKPEGIAVELCDCVIRVLDLCGKIGINEIDAAVEAEKAALQSYYGEKRYSLHELVVSCNGLLFEADRSMQRDNTHTAEVWFAQAIATIAVWLEWQKADWIDIMQRKVEYNGGRSYRHGGKIC